MGQLQKRSVDFLFVIRLELLSDKKPCKSGGGLSIKKLRLDECGKGCLGGVDERENKNG